MKKLLVLLLGLVMSLGIVSCGNKVDIPEYQDFEDQLDMPVGLSINDTSKTLSWDSVTGADGYAIYINDVKETEVDGTSYDFSSLDENHIIFNVKALGPRGVADSQLSTSIGYIANRDDEITAMELAISNSDMYLYDEEAFAEELVNKGMLASDFNTMMDEVDELNSMPTPDSFSVGYEAISSLIDSMDRYAIEAMVSSLINVELEVQLQEQLDYYNQRQEDYPWYDQEIEQTEGMLSFIQNHGDEAVRSVMIAVDYLLSVKEIMNEAMIQDIDDLVDDASSGTFDSSVFVTLKNDLVTEFQENLPPLEDIILLNMTVMTFAEAMSGDNVYSSDISVAKQSASALMQAELMFNFLLAIDEDYVDAAYNLSNNPSTNNQKALVKETLSLYDTFLDDQDDFINAMDDIFTDEEKEEMFFQYYMMMNMNNMVMNSLVFGYINSTDYTSEMETLVEKYFNYDDVLLVQGAVDAAMNDMLDAIIESDYAIVDSAFDLVEYYNTYDGEQSPLLLAFINDMLDLINPIVQDGEVETYNAMANVFVASFFINTEMMYMSDDYYTPTDVDFDQLYTIVTEAIDETDDHQLNVLKAMIDTFETTTYIEDFVGFMDNQLNNEDSQYGAIIVLANLYIDVYDEASADIDAIIDELIDALGQPVVTDLTDMTSADITELETMINETLTDLYDQANLIKDYDFDSLTTAQRNNVENFMMMLPLFFGATSPEPTF